MSQRNLSQHSGPLIVIPARGGSKRLPHKNLRQCGGKSLIRRAVDTAREADVGPVLVSTDCEQIKAEVFGYAEIIDRPAPLAADDSPTVYSVQHAIEGRQADTIIVMQCTNPFVRASDIRGALSLGLLPVAARPGGFWIWSREWIDSALDYSYMHHIWPIHPSVDIDTELDLTMAETLLNLMATLKD